MEIVYEPPVSELLVPHLSFWSILLGFIFLAWFFTLEVNSKSRNIFKEILISLIASTFLGFGGVFLLLTARIQI